ncbi:MAG: hypothetical protein M3015_05460 [Bacteroidota bacterium]|nr:hypothetical protein [Bacteroidota bacterium]
MHSIFSLRKQSAIICSLFKDKVNKLVYRFHYDIDKSVAETVSNTKITCFSFRFVEIFIEKITD